MNYAAFAFLGLILTLLSYTALRLFTAIQGNYSDAGDLRRQFAQRIRLLPLFKVLQKKGIVLNEWLYDLPVAEIENSIRQCESCSSTEKCQSALKQSSRIDFSYCANDRQFERYSISEG